MSNSNLKVSLIGVAEICEAIGNLAFPEKGKIAAERAFEVQYSSWHSQIKAQIDPALVPNWKYGEMFYITSIPNAENSEGEEPYFKVRGNVIAVALVPDDVMSQRYREEVPHHDSYIITINMEDKRVKQYFAEAHTDSLSALKGTVNKHTRAQIGKHAKILSEDISEIEPQVVGLESPPYARFYRKIGCHKMVRSTDVIRVPNQATHPALVGLKKPASLKYYRGLIPVVDTDWKIIPQESVKIGMLVEIIFTVCGNVYKRPNENIIHLTPEVLVVRVVDKNILCQDEDDEIIKSPTKRARRS